MLLNNMKKCSGCKQVLPRLSFNKDRRERDGYCNTCRKCRKLRQGRYRKIRWEANQASQRKYNYKYNNTCQVCGKSIMNDSTLCRSCSKKGRLNPQYTDGSTPLQKKLRSTPPYRKWRKQVMAKSNKCMMCNSLFKLEAHHFYSVKRYPYFIHEVDNGVVLCKDCHSLFDKLNSRFEWKIGTSI